MLLLPHIKHDGYKVLSDLLSIEVLKRYVLEGGDYMGWRWFRQDSSGFSARA